MDSLSRTPLVAFGAALVLGGLAGCAGEAGTRDGRRPFEPTGRRSAASVQLTPSDASLVAGDTLRFRAVALDGSGAEVEADFEWSSSDAAVATVDGTGLATAVGEGRVTITARTTNATGRAALTVAAPGALRVESFAPDPLREGEPAVVRGAGFREDPARNRLLLDGREVSVTSASPEELRFTVPRFDCRPSRGGDLRVVAGSDTSSALGVRLRPAGEELRMEPGELRRIPSEEGLCVQLRASSESEAYLVGVQSTGASPGRTSVLLAGEAGAAVGALAAAVGAEGDRDPRAVPARGDRDRLGRRAAARVPALDRRLRHRRAEGRLRARERRFLASAPRPPRGPLSPAARASVVGPGAAVGDTFTVRVPDLDATCEFTEVRAVVRTVGERGVWLEDVANPAGGFTESDYRLLGDRLDGEVYDVARSYFGEPTDVDGNGRIVAVVTKELNAASPGRDGEGEILGFVFSGDLFPRSDCASSDGGELYYARAPDPQGTFGRAYSRTDALRLGVVTIGHELAHIIQVGRRLLAVDAPRFMESWVMEGQATLAEEVIGHAVLGNEPGRNYGFEVAFPGEDGTGAAADEYDWYSSAFVDLAHYFGFRSRDRRVAGAPAECSWLGRDPDPCDGRALWYGVSWSLLRWISDHFADRFPGGERELHRGLVDNAAVGFENLAAATGMGKGELLARWAAALYADDRVAGSAPWLTLPSWNLSDIFEGHMLETARLEPLERPFGSFEVGLDVAGGSSAYVLVEGDGRPPTSLRARDPAGGPLPARVQLWVLRLR